MIVLDSSALIEILKGSVKGKHVLDLINGREYAVTPFTIHEVLFGYKLNEVKMMEKLLNKVFVFDYDHKAANVSAALEKMLKAKGRMINKIDVFIAGICIEWDATLITCDSHFKNVDDLKLILV